MTPAAVSAPLIPASERRGLARRFGLVCAGALFIAVASALVQADAAPPRYHIAAAYAFGISLLTWALIDIGRIVLRRPLGAPPPGYWPRSGAKVGALIVPGIALGYLGGTGFGDWVAGHSTFELIALNPTRFFGVLAASIGVSLASIGYFVQRGKSESIAWLAQQARLDLLVSQLEPHMLFNTLANLRVLIARDPTQAQAMLDRLVSYLRTTLAASRAALHPLAAEFARSSDYLTLKGMRMGPRLQVRLGLPEALRDHPVPTLLLQPLVENAIVHGLEPAVRGGRIEIHAARRGGPVQARMLELTVRDTGVGMRQGVDGVGGSGYGLTHVRERLDTLYGASASLQLAAASDAEGGTVATLLLPAEPATPT